MTVDTGVYVRTSISGRVINAKITGAVTGLLTTHAVASMIFQVTDSSVKRSMRQNVSKQNVIDFLFVIIQKICQPVTFTSTAFSNKISSFFRKITQYVGNHHQVYKKHLTLIPVSRLLQHFHAY